MSEVKKSELQKAYEELLDAGIVKEPWIFASQHSTEDNVKRFDRIASELSGIYDRKNRDYGNSFDISLDEDGLLVSKIRLGDKYKRFSQLIDNDAQVKDESIRDTLVDMANYAIMTVMWMDAKAEIAQMRKMVVQTV